MARSVADLVLVRGDFAVVPQLVSEGRRILRNLQRVTKLFVAKSMVAAFLILVIGISPTAYPLLPRHLTLVALLAVGIPSFFLALAPEQRSRDLRPASCATSGTSRSRPAQPSGLASSRAISPRSRSSTCRWSRREPSRRP